MLFSFTVIWKARLMFETQNMGYIIDEGNGHDHGAKRNWLRVNVNLAFLKFLRHDIDMTFLIHNLQV